MSDNFNGSRTRNVSECQEQVLTPAQVRILPIDTDLLISRAITPILLDLISHHARNYNPYYGLKTGKHSKRKQLNLHLHPQQRVLVLRWVCENREVPTVQSEAKLFPGQGGLFMSDADVEKPGWLADHEEQTRTWRESIGTVVTGLVDIKELRDFVEGVMGMPGCSVGNTVLVLFQFIQLKESGLVSAGRPIACLGFHKWKARGRHVQTGQQGMRILRPVTSRLISSGVVGADGKTKMRVLRSREQPPEGAVPKVKVFGFQASTVFDVSQTEGYPIVSRDKTAPVPDLVRDAVAAELGRLGYGVRLGAGQKMDDRTASASLGTFTLPGGNLVLIHSEDIIARVEALTYELGHIAMGHAGQHSTRQGREEVEAGVVAGMLNVAYGLNMRPIRESYDSTQARVENVTQMVGKTLDSARRRVGKHSANITASVGVTNPLAPLEIPPVGTAVQALKETGAQSSAIEVAPHETVSMPPPLVWVDQLGMQQDTAALREQTH